MSTHESFREGKEAPPRGVRVMAVVRWAILLAVAAVAFVTVYDAAAGDGAGEHAGHQHGPRYYCPMHPEITSDVPGECPICHMTLEPIPPERLAAMSGAAAPSAAPAPSGSAAPTPSSSRGPSRKGGGGPGAPAAGSAAPPELPRGATTVTLSFDRVQRIGVRTEEVLRASSSEPLRVAAILEAPERSAAEVHVRTSGFLETLAVREVGVRVHAGQPLAGVYSAEVLQAEQDLLTVLEWKQGVTGERSPVEDARHRLELLGVPRAVVQQIETRREAVRAVPVLSPIDGYVVKKTAVLGAFVSPETSLFDIVGLERVYVVASVAPEVASRVKVGDAARFVSPALPGRTFDAKVDLVYPVVDPVARTARVRFSLKNADQMLRPGQVGTAELPSAVTGEELTVPLDAVVDTGRSAYVFVAEGEGRFSPRAVVVGEQRGERIAVTGALHEGDRVVSRATFLVDAESRLRASFVDSAGGSSHAGHGGGAAP